MPSNELKTIHHPAMNIGKNIAKIKAKSVPNVPGALGASPEPKPKANKFTGDLSSLRDIFKFIWDEFKKAILSIVTQNDHSHSNLMKCYYHHFVIESPYYPLCGQYRYSHFPSFPVKFLTGFCFQEK